jgi:Lrp/AsnC family transcriptional regulator
LEANADARSQRPISKRVALIAPEVVGLGLTVLVTIEAGRHADDWSSRWSDVVSGMPEVLTLYRMAGETDYEPNVVVANMAAYYAFCKKLIAEDAVRDVTSRFVMERIKGTTDLPIMPEKDLV